MLNAPAIEGLATLEAGSVSGVVMRSFLEHEHRPRELLDEVARVLECDGAAIIKVPNFGSVNRAVMGARWCGFRFPGHANYFTPGGLRSMVEQAALSVVRFRLIDRFPFSDNMWMLAARRSFAGSTVPRPRCPPDIVPGDPTKRSR